MNPRRQLGAAVIENTIYAVGGIISINTGDNMELALASVESYTFSDSAWTQSKNLDSARYEYAIVAVLGKLYVFGGSYRVINESKDLKSITMYDPFTNEWNIAGEMPSIRIAPAACVINDSVYIFGGLTRTGSNFNITSSIDVFDPKTGLWSQKGDMLQPRMSHQVVAVNGAVYILGGLAGDFTTVLSSVEIYNPSNNSCSNAPDMSVARKNFGVAVVEGTIYAIGGLSSVVSQEVLTKVEAYNISEGEWVDKKSLPSGRHSFATCVYNRIIYVIGGTERKDLPLGQVGSVIKYYP